MDRRSFLSGLACLITAPAIVKASNLMPIKVVKAIPDCVEYYVSDCGSDWLDGLTPSTAFRSLQSALDRVRAFDGHSCTVNLIGGTHILPAAIDFSGDLEIRARRADIVLESSKMLTNHRFYIEHGASFTFPSGPMCLA